jgi:hypothetical protein
MKQIFAVMIALLLICGCGDEKESEVPAFDYDATGKRIGNIIVPLQVGNVWEYQVYALDTAVNDLRMIKIDTLTVYKDTSVNAERWYKMGGLQGTEGWVTNRKDGFWFARLNQQPFLFAKYPVKVGDRYTSLIGNVEAEITVAEIGAEVAVPAGTFRCHKYVQKVGPMEATTIFYFAPGVGLVKMSLMDRTGKRPIGENRLSVVTLISAREALQREHEKQMKDSTDGGL